MFKKIKKYIFNRYRAIGKNEIDYNKAISLQKKGAILIDVRSPKEYSEGHLKGAILIPEYEIKEKILQRVNDREKEIIVYCQSGVRAKKALETLEELGYNNVYNIYNGLDNIYI